MVQDQLKSVVLGRNIFDVAGAFEAVPVYGSGGFTTYDSTTLRDQLRTWTVEQRIPRVKIKIGESWGHQVHRDLRRMEQARSVVGDGVELFVDAKWLHDHVRIEQSCFDGTLDPTGGFVTPDENAAGNGLTVRDRDIDRFRVA